MATALVIGNMVGSGVFLLPALLAGEAGPVSLVALAMTGAGAVTLGLVFGVLGRAMPRTGGPYAYARRAFGEFVGFLTAWGYWIAAWVGNAAIAIALVAYLGTFWPTVETNKMAAWGVAVGTIWFLTGVNIIGVRQTGWLQLVTTVLKFVPLVVIGVAGLFFMDGGNFSPFTNEGVGIGAGITAAAALTLWAFIGLESATVPAEEVKDPEKTIPRATVLGTIATTLMYLIAVVAIFGIIPQATLAESNAPFADAAGEVFGGDWGNVIAVVALIATFGCLNGWILLQGRVPLAAARDRIFPKPFAWIDRKRGTPVFGLVVSSLLITALMYMNYRESLLSQFEEIILLATLSTLIPYAFAAAAEIHLYFTERELFSGRRLLADVLIASLGFAYAGWAMWGTGEEAVFKGVFLLLGGIPVYLAMKWWQRRETEKALVAPAEAEAPEIRVTVGAAHGR
jgi:APA family basic amino acid/polyamine antiporter